MRVEGHGVKVQSQEERDVSEQVLVQLRRGLVWQDLAV